jgi:hypothetical protein
VLSPKYTGPDPDEVAVETDIDFTQPLIERYERIVQNLYLRRERMRREDLKEEYESRTTYDFICGANRCPRYWEFIRAGMAGDIRYDIQPLRDAFTDYIQEHIGPDFPRLVAGKRKLIPYTEENPTV